MTIAFKHVPNNVRVPLFYAEVDNSLANTASALQRTLIIGQITSAGAATPNVPLLSQGNADAIAQGGPGSMLALMTQWYNLQDPTGSIWYLPIADGAATQASGSFKFTHVATANGTLSLYIAGQPISLPVVTTQTLAQLATALAAAINAISSLPVTAAVDGSDNTKVNITAKNGGLTGNDIDIRVNYYGLQNGEVTPAGLTWTLVAMASGGTNPSLTTALANCGDMPFDFIVCPYNDTTSLNALQSFLNDTSGRWAWNRMIFGHVFAAYRGTVGARQTFGATRNNQHESVIGFYDSPTPSWLWAANFAGACAASLKADPALPLHTLQLDVLAPPIASRDVWTDRNTLLYSGVSTFTVQDDGTCEIEGAITTYQLNGFGAPDDSYLYIVTMFTIMYLLRDLQTLVTSKYGRKKLAADGTRFAAGAPVVTPSIIAADIVARYRYQEAAGYVQGSDAFKAGLQVVKNGANRVDVLWDGILIDQLNVFALLFQFRNVV